MVISTFWLVLVSQTGDLIDRRSDWLSLRRVAVEVMFTKTTADVMWKDGRLERGIRSNDLIPIQHLDSHEFCPGDFVVDKRRKRRTHL